MIEHSPGDPGDVASGAWSVDASCLCVRLVVREISRCDADGGCVSNIEEVAGGALPGPVQVLQVPRCCHPCRSRVVFWADGAILGFTSAVHVLCSPFQYWEVPAHATALRAPSCPLQSTEAGALNNEYGNETLDSKTLRCHAPRRTRSRIASEYAHHLRKLDSGKQSITLGCTGLQEVQRLAATRCDSQVPEGTLVGCVPCFPVLSVSRPLCASAPACIFQCSPHSGRRSGPLRWPAEATCWNRLRPTGTAWEVGIIGRLALRAPPLQWTDARRREGRFSTPEPTVQWCLGAYLIN